MPVARLAAVAFLFLCLPVLAQDKLQPSEPWRIIPDQPTDSNPRINPFGPFANEYVFQVNPDGSSSILKRFDIWAVAPSETPAERMEEAERALVDDHICYTIHSFQVARDQKDSDSTHPVGSSTCRPARNFRLKNAQVQPSPADR